MKELFVYVCAVFIILYLVFVALQALKTYSPSIYEGIENAKDSVTNNSTEKVLPVTGVGSTSQIYSQTVSTAISALETELGMDAYSEQYLTILENLKILYKQRALKTALQTPTQKDNTSNLYPLYLYGKNIDTIEMLQDFVEANKKSVTSTLW